MSLKWFGHKCLSSPSLHRLSQAPPHYSCPEQEGGTAGRWCCSHLWNRTKFKQLLPKYSQCVAGRAGSLFLRNDLAFSSEISSRFPFPPRSLHWGLYYLKVRKVSSAEVCLGEKPEWFKRCHVRRRWRRVPSWYIREENVSSDVFVREKWLSVQPTLCFSFFPSQILF